MTTIKADPTYWADFVLERFTYNYKSDTIHWKSIYSADGCGSRIEGSKCNGGYLQWRVCGKKQMLHRIVWVLVTGKVPELELDHIDGNKQNNSYRNLREVDRSTNMHNNAAKGYSWNKARSMWQAEICVNYKTIYLGLFNTESEARTAFESAKKILGFIHR